MVQDLRFELLRGARRQLPEISIEIECAGTLVISEHACGARATERVVDQPHDRAVRQEAGRELTRVVAISQAAANLLEDCRTS